MKRVITYGTFDLLHYGHINLLKRAKALGDYLIVVLSTDEFNWNEKHKKCYFTYEQRKALLESIRYVDLVIPENNWEQKKNDVHEYHIDTFVMGDDWKGKFDFLKKEGVDVVYLPRTPEISTTQIKNDLHQKENPVKQGFTRYTNALDHFYANLDSLVKSADLSQRKIYMFGSSKVASMIIYYLKEHGVALAGIIDNNETSVGTRVLGLTIYTPEKLAREWDDSVLVLIASGYQDEMIRQLEDMGYRYGKHILKVIDLPKEMEDYSFVNRNGYERLSDQEVRETQLRALHGLKEICERENLRYYLTGGTLLGAVRHKGYIPWDDDIDIYMPVPDLKKLAVVMEAETDFGLITTAAGGMDYYDTASLLYDKKTILDTNHFPMQLSAGVTIDIFPLHGLPTGQKELYAYLEELKAAELAMTGSLSDRKRCASAAEDLFSLMEKYPFDEADFIGNILGIYQMREVFPARWFGKGVPLEFEGKMYNAPEDSDAYLRAIYGDYMQLPPEEKRQGHHFFHAYKIPHKQQDGE